jgi:hypothetical protein
MWSSGRPRVSILYGLGDATTGRTVMAVHHAGLAVHGAQVPWGKVVTKGVPVVAAGRLPSMLRALPAVLEPERVADLAGQARVRFHAAADSRPRGARRGRWGTTR